MSRDQRYRIFRRGSEAAENAGRDVGTYFCPICMRPFDEAALMAGELTLEHVPPRSVGGTGLVLTCKECNNTAGHTVEAELHRRANLAGLQALLLGGVGEGPVSVRVDVLGELVNGTAFKDGNGAVVIQMTPRNNDPRILERISARMKEEIGSGTITGTSRHRYNRRFASVAELRAAFLAAFAAFGYRYVFHARLTPVREQILRPGDRIIDDWMVPGAQPKSRYVVAHLAEPEAVFVQLDRRGVMLPWISGADNFYADLQERFAHTPKGHFTVTESMWPSTLPMRLDYDES